MNLLLDTHVFLWSVLAPERLSPDMAAALGDRDNVLWLSPISVWETIMLAEKGRLELRPDPAAWVRRQLARLPLREAPLTWEAAARGCGFDFPHRDPADRFLAGTAAAQDLVLVTADERLLAARGFKVFGREG